MRSIAVDVINYSQISTVRSVIIIRDSIVTANNLHQAHIVHKTNNVFEIHSTYLLNVHPIDETKKKKNVNSLACEKVVGFARLHSVRFDTERMTYVHKL